MLGAKRICPRKPCLGSPHLPRALVEEAGVRKDAQIKETHIGQDGKRRATQAWAAEKGGG